MQLPDHHPASYRDPSGYVFEQDGKSLRIIFSLYKKHYDQLISSGLYDQLTAKKQMVAHEEIAPSVTQLSAGVYKIISPEQIRFWSYPYEWSFGQLKDAALLTLDLALTGLEKNMILKDATAYNIQFAEGRPILIDSLSFECYEEGKPWIAFSQFCRHFLYPLFAFQHVPAFVPALLMAYPDGLPASLIASIAPFKKRFNINYWLYVFLPARLQQKSSGKERTMQLSKGRLIQNLQHLKQLIKNANISGTHSTWDQYYEETILSKQYLTEKEGLVGEMLASIDVSTVIDAGCNTGVFSRLASRNTQSVIALDFDHVSIDALYRDLKKDRITNILPLVADITNPSPALGWNNKEQKPLLSRLRADLVLALALIHHLALAKNIPLASIVDTFRELTTKYLIIEFVPVTDPKAQELLQHKQGMFPDYTLASFELLIDPYFETITRQQLGERSLFLLKKK